MLNAGDNLYLQEGEEVYTVSRRATLIGVYNMNKGYADFKQISILYQNDTPQFPPVPWRCCRPPGSTDG